MFVQAHCKLSITLTNCLEFILISFTCSDCTRGVNQLLSKIIFCKYLQLFVLLRACSGYLIMLKADQSSQQNSTTSTRYLTPHSPYLPLISINSRKKPNFISLTVIVCVEYINIYIYKGMLLYSSRAVAPVSNRYQILTVAFQFKFKFKTCSRARE